MPMREAPKVDATMAARYVVTVFSPPLWWCYTIRTYAIFVDDATTRTADELITYTRCSFVRLQTIASANVIKMVKPVES